MIKWLESNIATVIICLILLIVVAAIVYKLVSDKKKGKSSCGGNCSHCACSGSCRKK